jgi:ATP-dependent protease ClpP protease subunit
VTVQPENAMKWEAVSHLDDNTCEACRKNDGKLYRNRQAAFRDYPDNKGYAKCVGAKYGNKCRCRVRRRGKGGTNVGKDLATLVDRARALTAGMSANAQRPVPPEGAAVPPLENALRAAPANESGTNNALYLYSAIGGWDGIKALDVAQALAGMSGPLDVHLNSPGGFIFEGTAIYNAFKAYAGPIAMYIDGYAASAASFIAMAADPHDAVTGAGGIHIAENAFMMIHDGMGGAIGTAEDLRDVADLLDMLSDTIAATYARRAGGDAETWRESMQEGDTWYTAALAVSAGLADRVIGQVDEPVPDDDPAEENRVAELFAPAAAYPAMRPAALLADPAPATTPAPPPIDIEGLRNALKGAFL